MKNEKKNESNNKGYRYIYIDIYRYGKFLRKARKKCVEK